MPDLPTPAAQIRAAAALLLCAPEAKILDVLVANGDFRPYPLTAARQDYYDVICIPQSGRFVPPYEHVVRAAREEGGVWYFPPARYQGGDGVAEIFETFAFDRRALSVDPIWRAPHLPADHLGFMLAFVAWGLDGLANLQEQEDRTEVHVALGKALARFLDEHLGGWTLLYADLLADRGGPYLRTVSDAVRTAVDLAREALSDGVPPSVPVTRSSLASPR